MANFQDRTYLVTDQYKDASNLNARIQLHQCYSTNPYGWFQWMFDQLDLSAGAYILEIGCGSGTLWAENLPRLPSGWRIVLSDFSAGMVHACQPKLASRPDLFAYEVSDAAVIPFPAETFDAVIANHMLYHLPDRPRTISEIARVLKPAGRLYAATNGKNHLLELDSILLRHIHAGNSAFLPGHPSHDFSLENGAAQLAPRFMLVELRCYEDSLVVTEAQPLIAYIQSMVPRYRDQVNMSNSSDLEKSIIERMSREGCIRIQKSSGIFIAQK